jgi:DNA repair protein RadC
MIIAAGTDVANYLQALLKDYKREGIAALFLNRSNKINHFQIISEGGITGTVADPRINLK